MRGEGRVFYTEGTAWTETPVPKTVSFSREGAESQVLKRTVHATMDFRREASEGT